MRKVSAYGTVYNNVESIRASLDSVLVLPIDELVVVDNCSSDGTSKILAEYADKHKNVKVFRVKSTRGGGRQLAYRMTNGELVFSVDLDTVCSEPFREYISYLSRNYKNGEMWQPANFCSRKTMDYVGEWKNLQGGEDGEFEARTVSKGIKLKRVPIPVGLDYVSRSGHRESRYSKNSLGKYIRRGRTAIDIARGGTSDLKTLLSSKRLTIPKKIAVLSVYCCAQIMGSYRYDAKLTNPKFAAFNTDIILPSKIKIDAKWLYYPVSVFEPDILSYMRKFLEAKGIYEGRQHLYFFNDLGMVKEFIDNMEGRY